MVYEVVRHVYKNQITVHFGSMFYLPDDFCRDAGVF